MTKDESFISMRKSLDSFTDVALAEFDLIESEQGKEEFSGFVLKKVKEFLSQIAAQHQAEWLRLNPARAKQFETHAENLLTPSKLGCPPGFQEVGGICVRI